MKTNRKAIYSPMLLVIIITRTIKITMIIIEEEFQEKTVVKYTLIGYSKGWQPFVMLKQEDNLKDDFISHVGK